jgi:hypothetical protein
MDGAVDSRVVVGVDLHRRRTVLVAMDAQGRPVGGPVRVVSDPGRLVAAATRHGPCPRVVLEATYGWVRHEGV